MNNDNGSISYSVSLDHRQMNRDKQEVQNIFHQIGQTAQQEGDRVDSAFSASAKNIGKAFAAIGIAATMKEFGTQIMKVRGEFQKLEVAFEVMLGSAKEADSLMKQLTKTAATTPFDLQGVANGAKQLLAYGTAANEVNDMLVRLGNIASGLSIPLNDLVMLYGTTMTQGRLFTQDLRQFMGRGIPLADELAKQFGVAKEQVGELVTAGKVGAEEVRKAIESMTNEGGKFYGLMEKQSQTIAGQLSNLEDAIDSMFNSIGKDTQGIISAGISGVATLVENYETIGKILATLVTAYGTYKTALILQTAVQSAHAAVEAEAAVQMKLAAMAGHTLSIEQARAAATSNLLAAAQLRVRAAMTGIGSVLTNPYVLATAAVVGLIYAIYKLVTAESSHEKGVRAANDEIERQNNLLSERKNKIDSLIKTIQDANATAVQQAEAYRELQTLAPSLTDKYSQQELATLDAANAQKELNKQLDDTKYAMLQKNISDTEKEIKGLEVRFNSVSQAATQGSNMVAAQISAQIAKSRSALEEYKKQLSEYEKARKQAERENRPLDVKISEASKTLAEAKQVFDRLEAEMQAEQAKVKDNPWYQIPLQLIFDYNSAKKAYDDAERESKRLQGMTSKSHEQAQQEAMTAYNEAVKAEKEARKKSEVEWQAANKRLDEAKTTLKSVGIDIDAQNRKAEQTRNKAAQNAKQQAAEAAQRYEAIRSANERIDQLMKKGEQDRKQQILDMQNATEQAVINSLEDEGERARRQQELNNKLQIESLEKQKQDFINATIQAQKEIFDAQEDLKKAQDKNYSKKTFDSNGVSVDTSAYDNLIRLTKQSQTLEQLKAEKEAMNEYLREYGTFQQKRAAIKEQFEQKINEATTEGAKMSLRKQMQEALNEINLEELKDQLDWGVVLGDISNVTKKELQEVKKQLIAFKKSDAYKKQTPEQIKIIEEALNEINDNLAERGGLFGGLIESLDNYKVTVEELKKAQEEYEKAVTDSEKAEKKKALQQAQQNAKDAKTTRDKSIDSTINKLEELSSVVSQLGTASDFSIQNLGSTVAQVTNLFGEAAGKIGGLIGAILEILGAISDSGGFEKFLDNVFSNVFGAVGGIFSTLFGQNDLWGSTYDPALIERLTLSNANLEKAIDRLTNVMKDQAGKEATETYELAKADLERQMQNTQRMMQETADSYSNGFLGIGGSHSANSHIYDALLERAISNYLGHYYNPFNGKDAKIVNEAMSKGLIDPWKEVSEIVGKTVTDVWDFWNLSSEDMAKIADQNTELWTLIQSASEEGYKGVTDYMNEYIEYYQKLIDLQNEYNETVTKLSFDSAKSDLESLLEDTETDAEKVIKNVSQYMQKAIVNNVINGQMKNGISKWYQDFADAMADGVLDALERASLQQLYSEIYEQAADLRDAAMEAAGLDMSEINKDSSKDQNASRGGYETVSEETGTALLGRETSILMQATRIADHFDEIAPTLQRNSDDFITLQSATNEILFMSQMYLENISKNSDRLPDIDSKLGKIKTFLERNK